MLRNYLWKLIFRLIPILLRYLHWKPETLGQVLCFCSVPHPSWPKVMFSSIFKLSSLSFGVKWCHFSLQITQSRNQLWPLTGPFVFATATAQGWVSKQHQAKMIERQTTGGGVTAKQQDVWHVAKKKNPPEIELQTLTMTSNPGTVNCCGCYTWNASAISSSTATNDSSTENHCWSVSTRWGAKTENSSRKGFHACTHQQQRHEALLQKASQINHKNNTVMRYGIGEL